MSSNHNSPTPQHDTIKNADEQFNRHSVYYFDPVVFRVEGVTFKVPKYGFMVPGSTFDDMFSLPIPEAGQVQGSDEDPIDLPSGITQQEFFGFLFVMYPFLGGRAAYDEVNYEELVGALKLATMWQYPKIRSCAIHLLSPLFNARHPVDILLVAREYRSRSLLHQGYATLINQNITIETLRTPYDLDWETISRILSAKTRLMERQGSSVGPSNNHFVDGFHISGVGNCVQRMFKDELEKMEQDPDVDPYHIKKNYWSYLSHQQSDAEEVVQKDEGSQHTFLEAETLTVSINRPHHVYYVETILILVERTLFRLPKSDLERIIDHTPSEISVQSFSRFLTALYPQIGDRELVDHDEWLDVLHLSTHWGYTEIRENAIAMLSPLIKKRNAVETVLVARKYKVRAWMLSALEALANQSPKPTMVEELREPFELDWQTIAKILSIQYGKAEDDSWGSPSREESIDYNVGADKNGTGPMVAGLFEEEIKDWP